MFDPVQMLLFAQQPEEPFLPGALEQAAQVLDGLEVGIAGKNQFDREAVVGVDEKRHLLLAREGAEGRGGNRRPFGQHGLERAAVGEKGLVVHPALFAVRQPRHVFFQQRVPGRVSVVQTRRLRPCAACAGQQAQARNTHKGKASCNDFLSPLSAANQASVQLRRRRIASIIFRVSSGRIPNNTSAPIRPGDRIDANESIRAISVPA